MSGDARERVEGAAGTGDAAGGSGGVPPEPSGRSDAPGLSGPPQPPPGPGVVHDPTAYTEYDAGLYPRVPPQGAVRAGAGSGRTGGGSRGTAPRKGPVATGGRWLAQGIAVVFLVPFRLLWELLKLIGRVMVAVLVFFFTRMLRPLATAVHRWILVPAWRLLRDFLWGWVLRYVLWGLVLTPVLAFLLDWVLKPIQRAIERWLWNKLLKPLCRLTLRYVLRPVWAGLCWAGFHFMKWCVVAPLLALWRWVLRPLWRALRAVLVFGWKWATIIVGVLVVVPCRALWRWVLHPVWRAVAAAWRAVVVPPARWTYQRVLRPMNRAVADVVGAVFGR
ncbi:hypothetical protein [Yinghuangia soli]|uniref:Uncharacterized protein n=1 Tax=Yinghuangia soli TaxID=2908204 RepID=A0AA41Q499_9ACTN|nr:hypothetical protein [Yinghuangia soli]MCF2531278.1 hypothetical protein [Yinghuangia soli]